MKEVTILGETLKYEVIYDMELGWHTQFYLGEESKTSRKYWLFGPKITKRYPKPVFSIGSNIENPNYSRDEIRDILEEQVKTKVFRKREIENGELV